MTEIIKPEKRPEQKNNEKFVDFLNLSPEQKDELKKRIEENNGLVRIFVHPFFNKITPDYNKERAKKMKAMNLALQKILSLPEEKTPPILFFEEMEKISELEENIQAIGTTEFKNKVYTVPTFRKDPEPAILDADGKLIRNPEKHWKIMNEKLKSVGIKKIIIGGMEFMTYAMGRTSRNKPDEIKFLGCVGEAIRRLSDDFDVEVSHLTFPENRQDFDEIKQRANRV